MRNDLGEARTQLEQADPNDAPGIGRSVVAATNVVGAVGNSAQALSALDGNPQLDAAFDQAQSCQRLRSSERLARPPPRPLRRRLTPVKLRTSTGTPGRPNGYPSEAGDEGVGRGHRTTVRRTAADGGTRTAG